MGSRYELLTELASGGMGAVYIGRLRGDRGFSRPVAIKRIRPDLAADADARQMLENEAKLTAQVTHPNVVQVFELVESVDGLQIVMELVEGVSLRALLAALGDSCMDIPQAVAIVAKCADGLHAAHEAVDSEGRNLGLVHRDVSPHNILVSFNGEVKLTDFGIAKAMRAEDRTRSSGVKGKPAYLAPEQARGSSVDRRCDVFALGIVAWETLTGQRLFKGRNDLETLRLLLEEEIPRCDAVRHEVPAALADVVATALSRDPILRHADAAAFRRALDEACPEARAVRTTDLAQSIERTLPGEAERLRALVRRAMRQDTTAAPTVGWARRITFFAAGFGAVVALRLATLDSPAELPIDSAEPAALDVDFVESEPVPHTSMRTETVQEVEPFIEVVQEVEPSKVDAPARRPRMRREQMTVMDEERVDRIADEFPL